MEGNSPYNYVQYNINHQWIDKLFRPQSSRHQRGVLHIPPPLATAKPSATLFTKLGMNVLRHDLGFSHRACDRCHGQKLRCRRDSNSSTCVRCARAGVRCIPRPMNLRQRAESLKENQVIQPNQQRRQQQQQPLQSHVSSNSTQQHHRTQDQDTNEINKDLPDNVNCLPLNLLDMSSNMNTALDPSSLVANIHPVLVTRYSPPPSDTRPHNLHSGDPSFSQVQSQLRTSEQMLQTRWSDFPGHDDFNDLCDFSLSPTMPTARHRLSLDRDVPLLHAHPHSQDDIMVELHQEGARPTTSNGKLPNTDSGHANGLSPSDLLRSPYGDKQHSGLEPRGSQQDQDEPLNTTFSNTRYSNMTTWIHRLSDINVLLHQHMHSIPALEPRKKDSGNRPGSSHSSMESEARLPVDSTLKISGQYTNLLTSICTRFEACRSCGDTKTLAQLALDQPSQLLVLSSYMCVLESYNHVLQHIKAWLEVRLKMGVRGSVITIDDDESAQRFPARLPRLAVGSFEVSKTSSTQPLVLICILETNIMQMHSLINEIMRPVSESATASVSKTTTASEPLAADTRSMTDNSETNSGLSSVAKVTVQAIEANEDATLRLMHVVSELALRRVML